MAKHLSDLECRKAKPDPGRRVELHDGKVPGLSLRITTAGVKSWSFIFRQHGKRSRITLGRYPALTLEKAREKATEAQGRVYKGETPEKARKALSGAEIATMSQMIDAFVAFYKASGKRSWAGLEMDLSNHVKPEIGHRVPAAIRKGDLKPILHRFELQPYLHNRLLSHLGGMFKWAAEHDHVEANPVVGIRRKKVQSRDRVLTDAELKAIWTACGTVGWPYGPFFRLLMITGQRRGEVAAMSRGLIGHNTRLWEIPPEIAKNGRAHLVPLPQLAMDIIDAAPVFEDENGKPSPWVFPAQTKIENHLTTFSDGKELLDKVSGVTGWRGHDLRRTMATNLAGLGISGEVIEAALNHVSGTRAGVAGVYNRHAYLDERRAALDAWAARLQAIVKAG